MKAIVYTQYGSPDVLQMQEFPQPVPAENEVLVKVHAASVNAGDRHLLRGKPFLLRLMMGGLRKPKYPILGADIAGTVAAVGSAVTNFQPGDEVFGDTSPSGFGAFSEYVVIPESGLALKPAHLTFEEAAAVPSAAITALQGLRNHGQIQAGQKVLINGASGGVGTFAVQIAKALGAEVTGVCSTRNVEMVRGIGADHVIDYKKEDFTANDPGYDLILDAAAYRPLSDYQRALGPQGSYVLVGGSAAQLFKIMFMGPWLSKKGGQRFCSFVKKLTPQDLAFMKELLESGQVDPVIDRRYPFAETAEALRYMEAGHTQGKVIISMDAEEGANDHHQVRPLEMCTQEV